MIPKSAESVNASVASSGSACDLASLGFGFSFFRVFSFSRRVLGSAERSDADLYQDKHTPQCQQLSLIINFCVHCDSQLQKYKYLKSTQIFNSFHKHYNFRARAKMRYTFGDPKVYLI